MNVKKTVFFGFFLLSLVLPIVTFVYAQKVPDYVGIKESATYVWKTEFDVDNLADYYRDLLNDTSESSEVADELAAQDFDSRGWSSKTKAWKLYIVDLYPEREEKLGGKEYDRVKCIYNWYKSQDINDPNAWRKKAKYDTLTIYEPDEDLYKTGVSLLDGMSDFFVPKDLNFDKIYRDIKDDIDDIHEASIGKEQVQYFTSQKTVGLRTELEFNWGSEQGWFSAQCRYNDDGILYFYEWRYSDTIVKLELDTIGGTFLYENFWWISIVALVSIVSVICVGIILVIRRKKKVRVKPQTLPIPSQTT